MLVAALSTEAFVNVYVKCQDVVTAKPRYVSTFDSEKKSKRLSGIQQHFKGRGAVNSVVLLLPGLWTARCTGVQYSVGAHLSTCFCYKVYKRAS